VNEAVMVLYIARVVAMLGLGWLVLTGYRYVRARSTVMASILGLAIIVRGVLGVALFTISYLHLPIAESLQVGDGFWQPALDATGYYQLAAGAADAGTLFDGPSASPFYVDTLALWMNVVGISPAAGMFLNLCLYVALVVSLVWCFRPINDRRHDLPCIVVVAAYSFSPIALFNSTQPLKDELFAVLVAMACLGLLGIGRLMHSRAGVSQWRHVAAGTLAVTAAVLAGAGIRWYYPIIVWSTLAVILALFAIVGRTTPLPRYLAGSAAVLLTVWVGFWAGSGPATYWMLAPDPRALAEFPSRLLTFVQVGRAGFLTSGGGTNIVVPLRSDAASGRARSGQLARESHDISARMIARRTGQAAPASSPAPPSSTETAPPAPPPSASPSLPSPVPAVDPGRAIPITMREQLGVLATGLAVVFVPISLVQTIVGIAIPGGRGLLAFADADTVYMDVVTIIVLAFLWRRRAAIGDRLPFVVFGLVLSAVTALLLGYVVTNYGTLWRMRPLVTVPLWVLVVALSWRARETISAPSATAATT
jgi:hypothetical protein